MARADSRDALLQRYALLLTRVQSLTKYISEPPKSALPTPGPSSRPGALGAPGAPGAPAPRAEPALAHYLVHPLRALPPDADALAHDVLFQAINTQPLPSVDTSSSADPTQPSASASAATRGMLGLDALRALDEGALTRVSERLKARLGRESERANAMAREIERRAEEYDWAYRPDAEEGEKGGEGEGEGEEDEEDLFGDDEEMEGKEEEKLAPNPREGWSVGDYLALLDTGRVKAPEPAAPAAAA